MNELLRRNSPVVGPLLLLAALIFVLAQSYDGRVHLVDSQRNACERGKLDRAANSAGWWTAEQARITTADDPRVTGRERAEARVAAEQYGAIAAELEARASIDCTTAFPAPSFRP